MIVSLIKELHLHSVPLRCWDWSRIMHEIKLRPTGAGWLLKYSASNRRPLTFDLASLHTVYTPPNWSASTVLWHLIRVKYVCTPQHCQQVWDNSFSCVFRSHFSAVVQKKQPWARSCDATALHRKGTEKRQMQRMNPHSQECLAGM